MTDSIDGIAIIGMAGRFPGARNVAEFWENLLAGRDTITRFSSEQLEARNTGAGEAADYVAARGVLEDVGLFDAAYFGIAPREAERMDPQHRLFLESCSNALEDAGYDSAAYPGEIALFAGCSLNTYLLHNLASGGGSLHGTLDELTGQYQVGDFQTALGNDKDFLTTRVAYKLNLRGPVVTVQSACATSLVAVCQAAQALLNFQCDMALAGGVSITFPQHRGHTYQEGGIVSRDGHCRPFDADATGTVFGHGAGVVVLKRLEDAVRDGDSIAAVTRGFAVNNDGSAKAGYMAPGVDGQARAIAAAQAMAGIGPDTITCIEAHGTGTPLGDPVEIAALTQVFRAGTDAAGFCTVGTAKGNVGHLDSAAGVTGLIKTVLSLQHRTLPGLAHFATPNPNIDLANSPFQFHAENRAWDAQSPLRAGVSAFGVGGVNAHVVLEEAPASSPGSESKRRQVLCVSGRSEAAAQTAARQLAVYLRAHPEVPLADIAYTLACGRKPHEFRIAVAAHTAEEAANKLDAARAGAHASPAGVAFLFSGQGTQFAGMGRELYETEPAFREVIDSCADDARDLLQTDLRDIMFAATPDARLDRTEFAQPALYATELALAALWRAWGIEPAAMAGHSLGDFVAATLAGVWSARDGIRLVCRRAQLMQRMQPGAMLSVALSEVELRALTNQEVSLAAVNGPRSGVLAGTFAAIAALEAQLALTGVACRRLHTSHAFHSTLMQPMVEPFRAAVATLSPRAPSMPFVSSVTGKWITAQQAADPTFWALQCVQPVRFAEALACLQQAGAYVLLEAGPGDTLTRLAQQAGGRLHAIPSFTAARANRAARSVGDALAALWQAGALTDWAPIYAREFRRRVSLPTYPFERTLHWVEPAAQVLQPAPPLPIEAPPIALEPAPESIPSGPRSERLRVKIAEVFTTLSGIETTPEEAEHPFLELGFDSLFLTQATQSLSKTFGIKITFRQLMEDFSTVAALAAHLDAVLPPDAFPTAQPAGPDAAPVSPLLAEQLAAMSKSFADQLATLRAAAGLPPEASAASSKPRPTLQSTVPTEVRMVRPSHARSAAELTAPQAAYLAGLIATYTAMTPGSKAQTQQGRSQLADPRAVAGFRAPWKEMVYPLLVEHARGSRLWDVDGNEFIDVVNGYGCILFGHSPAFVVEAAREQLERGVAIGPQTPLAAEVAALICELTGNERVTFCNTGSEAVMAAIRVARTVTGRDKIVYFTGDYHGTFDEVLVRNTPRGSAPVAPGIPLAGTANVVVLEYGADASLDYIRAHGEDIAAVLIEPVQTRNPALQPFDFIRSLRAITEQTGSAFILDEVVTGFRLAPGGMQQLLGLRADMCTYGKVIGGGHPIGVLSGKRMYLDALDGGAWQFGDDSGPEVGVTFFAGTFVRHPLALAAAKAVLTHLKTEGPSLQQSLNARTATLAESLDRFFAERGVPSRVHAFCSWFYFTFPHDARLAPLFYYAMRARGIHIQEGYPCFLTTAHSDADLAQVEQAFRDTIDEMQAAGAMPCEMPGRLLHPLALATTARVPLTEPQREIFLAAALNDEANCAFNESLTLELRGPVRLDALQAALATVLARHDALRSAISEDGEWLQTDGPHPIPAAVRDLSGMDVMSREAAVIAAIEQEAATPFDLLHGPLVRVTCFTLGAAHAIVLLNAHHIVLDGWSANQLLEECGRLYSEGPRAELAPLLPFSSYATREHARTAAHEFDGNEAYWVERFTGRSPRLELPLDRPRGLSKSYRGSTFAGALDATLTADLKRVSARSGCTLYVTLLAGFQMLLHRLTGQDEVVVGISAAGQALHENASLVGHAVSFLPILSELSPTSVVKDRLRATRTTLLDAYDHQEFTYGSLLRRLKLEREPGRMPLIEVQFNLEKVGETVRFDGLTHTIKANGKRYVNTDLFLNVVETPTALAFTCDFNSDLFDEETIARWLRHWTVLLTHLAADTDAEVARLPLLDRDELLQTLAAGNETAVDFGPFEPLTTAFLRRAEREPRRIAVECGTTSWTNAQLAGYARNLAAELLRRGLQPGDLAAICVDRSPEMLGAVLAVMLAGGAYLPLDPRHPNERLATVVDDAGAAFLLVRGAAPIETKAHTIDLSAPLREGSDIILPAVKAGDLAYVIYTSGSTGKPKGVAIEHHALMNLLHSMEREPGLKRDDVLVAITTLAFDISALELLLPLLTGARLVIATDAEVQDGRALLHRLTVCGATAMQATPGAWRLLLEAGWTAAIPLKVWCGGEALPRELADRLLERAAEVWNLYGPTETTIWSAAARVTHGSGSLRIGPAIANTQLHVLDAHRQIVPAGVIGELYIGGEGLARGYWNRPALTDEKFIHNPFGAGRLYATGDLARAHGDGTFELLGRKDFQVKVRGYRIELNEIEAAIAQHPAVGEAVLVQQSAGDRGHTRLIAYLVASHASVAAELPALLARTLPDYMIPARFVVLPALPRTANGKLDRRSLVEQIAAVDEPAPGPFAAPSTPAEETLARIFADVLELPRVSVTESIFELGADSLLIFRIAARAQREGMALNATEIFQHRSVAGICRALEKRQGEAAPRMASRIVAAARDQYRVARVKSDA